MKPVTPDEIEENLEKCFPPEVIEVFNELIKSKYRNGKATFKLKEAAILIAKKLNITQQEVYNKNYLDIKKLFDEYGWNVKEDRPAWMETYDGYWVFSKK